MIKPEINVAEWQDFEQEIVKECLVLDQLIGLIKQTIVGQEILIERLMIGLLCNGHILLEGMPGLAKTLTVKTLAQSIATDFSRIQFTPDILPADILGTTIYNIHTNEFAVKKGPIFSNFILADEINRAPEKVQSALLEVMQEHQVTIGNNTYKLDLPFMVLATQNPIDQAGTYQLPEAQMDRFMLKVHITYPTKEEEKIINRKKSTSIPMDMTTVPVGNILRMQQLVNQVHVDEKIEDYILDIIHSTRWPEQYNLSRLQSYIKFGASPRGTINLTHASRAYAFLNKRAYVIPADVYAVTLDVLRHRIGLNYTAMAENITTDFILQEILNEMPKP
ncbi:MoxR family ATPase [Flavobacterium sp.]|uniref:AAA family ATPase n=1 Tax=Flavobacterium sp. TaxID=239 RepID=UPI00286A5A03|nr:MoxR family ATPase [Flavobacterium sp.]